jgi:glutamate 5-kinase
MARFVIKLGSAMASRDEVLAHVCACVAARRAGGDEVVIVSSGAIARGVIVLDRPTRPTTIEELQAASAVGQGALFRLWHDQLATHGVLGAQVLLTSYDLSVRAHYLNARQTLQTLLGWGVVPVVNENDTTATEEISFSDNDFLAAQVAILVGADLMVVLTDTEGVYTADPRSDPAAALVGEVRDMAQLDRLAIGHNTGPMGTGGMRSKVVAAEIAAAGGIETVITTGLRAEALSGALDGADVGTRFRAGAARYSSF